MVSYPSWICILYSGLNHLRFYLNFVKLLCLLAFYLFLVELLEAGRSFVLYPPFWDKNWLKLSFFVVLVMFTLIQTSGLCFLMLLSADQATNPLLIWITRWDGSTIPHADVICKGSCTQQAVLICGISKWDAHGYLVGRWWSLLEDNSEIFGRNCPRYEGWWFKEG